PRPPPGTASDRARSTACRTTLSYRHAGCAVVAGAASGQEAEGSAEEPQIVGREPSDVRQDHREVARRHPEPPGERGRVLIGGGGGDPSPLRGEVVRPAQ